MGKRPEPELECYRCSHKKFYHLFGCTVCANCKAIQYQVRHIEADIRAGVVNPLVITSSIE